LIIGGIGYIMDAMITGNCFFTSDGEIGQSFIIFQILGTPNEDK
jgi:hypothetical protein